MGMIKGLGGSAGGLGSAAGAAMSGGAGGLGGIASGLAGGAEDAVNIPWWKKLAAAGLGGLQQPQNDQMQVPPLMPAAMMPKQDYSGYFKR